MDIVQQVFETTVTLHQWLRQRRFHLGPLTTKSSVKRGKYQNDAG